MSIGEEVVEFPAVLFGRAADLALAFAGVEAGGLELEAFDLFGGGDVDVVVDGLGELEAMIEEAGDFDSPAFLFRLYFVFVAYADGFGCFCVVAVVFNLAFGAGVGGLRAGFEEADGPEIFVEAELFFFGHADAGFCLYRRTNLRNSLFSSSGRRYLLVRGVGNHAGDAVVRCPI